MVGGEDLKILNVLKQNSKLSVREISKRTKIPATTVHTRLKKLKKGGIIKKYTVELDMEKLGRPILAYVNTSADYGYLKKKNLTPNKMADRIIKHPFIEFSSAVTGRVDIVFRVRVKDIQELDALINFLRTQEGILSTETLVVLYEAENNSKLFEEDLVKGK